jgi:hypothetical protein
MRGRKYFDALRGALAIFCEINTAHALRLSSAWHDALLPRAADTCTDNTLIFDVEHDCHGALLQLRSRHMVIVPAPIYKMCLHL